MKLLDMRILNGTAVSLGVFGLLFALSACQSPDRRINQTASEEYPPSGVMSPEMWPAFNQAFQQYSAIVAGLSGEHRTYGLAGSAYFHARIGRTDEAGRAINRAIRLHNRQAAEMRPASLDTWHYDLLRVAEAQAKAGDLPGAKRTVAAIRQTAAQRSRLGHQDDTRSLMSEAYVRIGMLEQGLAEARSIADPLGRASVLINVARAQASADQRDTARQTFAEALTLLESNQEDFDTFRRSTLALVDAMLEREFFEAALDAVSRIEHSLVRYEALGKVIRAQLQSGRIDEALTAVDRCSYDGWNSPFFPEVAQALLAGRPVSAALEAGRNIQEPEPRAAVLLEIARARANSGDLASAHLLLEEAEAILVDHKVRSRSNGLYAPLAKMQAETGLIRQSLITAAKLHDGPEFRDILMTIGEALAAKGTIEQRDEYFASLILLAQAIEIVPQRTEVLTSIAYSPAKVGLVSHSLKVVDEIPDRRDRLRILAGVASRLVESTDKNKANEVFLGALTEAQAAPASARRDRYLADIALAQAEAALWSNALQTAHSIEDGNIRQATEISVARRMVGSQDRHEAVQLLAELRNQVLLVEASAQRDRILHEIALAHAEAGLWNEAREISLRIEIADHRLSALFSVAEQMVEAQEVAPMAQVLAELRNQVRLVEASGQKDRKLRRIALISAKAGLWNHALHAAGDISSAGDSIGTMISILEAMPVSDFGGIGDTIFDQVLGRLRHMESGLFRDRNLVRMADLAIERGWGDQAVGIIERVENITEQIKWSCALGRRYARSGRLDDARNALTNSLRFVPESDHDSSTAWALVSLAETQLELGFYSDAVGMIGKIEDRLKRAVELEQLLLFLLGEREDSGTDIQESE